LPKEQFQRTHDASAAKHWNLMSKKCVLTTKHDEGLTWFCHVLANQASVGALEDV
jgi:hypothetical protein